MAASVSGHLIAPHESARSPDDLARRFPDVFGPEVSGNACGGGARLFWRGEIRPVARIFDQAGHGSLATDGDRLGGTAARRLSCLAGNFYCGVCNQCPRWRLHCACRRHRGRQHAGPGDCAVFAESIGWLQPRACASSRRPRAHCMGRDSRRGCIREQRRRRLGARRRHSKGSLRLGLVGMVDWRCDGHSRLRSADPQLGRKDQFRH